MRGSPSKCCKVCGARVPGQNGASFDGQARNDDGNATDVQGRR